MDKATLINVKNITTPDSSSSIDLYQKRKKIYTRRTAGIFENIRTSTICITLSFFFVLPWLNWEGRQAVIFDIAHRKFHWFHLTFWPQDFILLALGLIVAAFGLFFITNLVGRVWCGYTCPQTVWTKIFTWIEEITEGQRHQRIRLDQSPLGINKLARKSLKHFLWLAVSLWTAISFMGYFFPIRSLSTDFLMLEPSAWPSFWICFFTIATYLNAGWLREQICIYVCPYARFQSVMFDKSTLTIAYDFTRGEPRGNRRPSAQETSPNLSMAKMNSKPLGDCIDCQVCVQVCPTGIDIRDGLQYECIGCAACIDACNNIMEKIGSAKGLIRYTTENQLAGEKKAITRPRLLGYGLAFLVTALALMSLTIYRPLAELDIQRDRNSLYRHYGDDLIENTYQIKITNKTHELLRYKIELEGPPSLRLISNGNSLMEAKNFISSQGNRTINVQVIGHLPELTSSHIPFKFTLQGLDNGSTNIMATAETSFISPRIKQE